MASDSEKARPQTLPPTSKASGIEETTAVRKMADENTRKSHIGSGSRAARATEGRVWKEMRFEEDKGRRLKESRRLGGAHDCFSFFSLSLLELIALFHVGPLNWGATS